MNQDSTVVQFNRLIVFVGNEVRRQIAALELHPFDQFNLGLHLSTFFDGDHAILADLHQGVGQSLADLLVVVAGDTGDHLDGLAVVGLNRLRQLPESLDNIVDSFLHTAPERNRGRSSGNELETMAIKSLRKHGRGGRAVAGNVTRLGSSFLHQLHTAVLVLVLKFDVLGDGHTVLGDLGRPPALVEDGISATRPQGT